MNRFVISSIVGVSTANVSLVADHGSVAASVSSMSIHVNLLTSDCLSSSSITVGGSLRNEVIIVNGPATGVASKSENGFLNSWSTSGFSENRSALLLLTS